MTGMVKALLLMLTGVPHIATTSKQYYSLIIGWVRWYFQHSPVLLALFEAPGPQSNPTLKKLGSQSDFIQHI